MLSLKFYASIPTRRLVTNKDREDFKTLSFNPEELIELKEMNHEELLGLMEFCGIRVFNGIPLVALEDDELRMAYCIWRSLKIKERAKETIPKVRKGIRWLDYIRKAVETATN